MACCDLFCPILARYQLFREGDLSPVCDRSPLCSRFFLDHHIPSPTDQHHWGFLRNTRMTNAPSAFTRSSRSMAAICFVSFGRLRSGVSRFRTNLGLVRSLSRPNSASESMEYHPDPSAERFGPATGGPQRRHELRPDLGRHATATSGSHASAGRAPASGRALRATKWGRHMVGRANPIWGAAAGKQHACGPRTLPSPTNSLPPKGNRRPSLPPPMLEVPSAGSIQTLAGEMAHRPRPGAPLHPTLPGGTIKAHRA